MSLERRIERLEALNGHGDHRPQPPAEQPDDPIHSALVERGLIRWQAGGWELLAPIEEIENAYLAVRDELERD